MKFKREIIIISLIIAMLFTVSSVCAVDSEIQATGAQNSTVEVVSASNDNDDLGMNNAGEILGNPDGGTYLDLSSKISGATENSIIYLENDYDYSTGAPASITINVNNLTIDGQGHSIDAKQQCRIFSSTTKLTLRNIIFLNAYSAYGAVYSQSPDLLIDNCTFIDNTCTRYWGGAICVWSGSKATIVNSTFKGNINHGDQGMGGAVGVNGYALIENCTFENNNGTYYGGGAVGVYYSGSADISNSTFIDNHATDDTGGAIEVFGTANIDTCVFLNNSASEDYGNAICFNGQGGVTNSIFINNPNGVIYSYVTGVTASQNWFGNTIDDYETPIAVVENVEMNDYLVLNLDLNNDDGIATVSLNNLYENGVLTPCDCALPSIKFNVSSKGIIVRDEIVLGSNGRATIEYTPTDVYELTISYNGVELTKDIKPTFALLKDKIDNGGNQISLDKDYEYDYSKDGSLTIVLAKDISIDGQGHYIDGKNIKNIFYFDDSTKNLTLMNIVFKNAFGTNGAAVYFNGNKIEIINCTFINNKATSHGDALYVANANGENKISESKFVNNTGSNSVAYINLDSSNAKFNISNSIFINNTAQNIVKGNGDINADYNWWGNNASNYNVCMTKTDGITVTNWLFLNITADEKNSIATISLNNLFENNAVYFYKNYALPAFTLNVKKESLNANDEIALGGNGKSQLRYVLTDYTGCLTVSYFDIEFAKEVNFVDDYSFTSLRQIISFYSSGDVIVLNNNYTYNATKDKMTAGILIDKVITIDGNGHKIDAKNHSRFFYIEENTPGIVLNNITFLNGKSLVEGGAIYSSYSSDFDITNCIFINNTAASGGALYSYWTNINFINCTFINNSASNIGGSLMADVCDFSIFNCTFTNNSAYNTAVLYNDGNRRPVNIINSTFKDNRASTGYIVYCYYSPSFNIENSSFIGNNVSSSIVYAKVSTGLKITNSNFTENIATQVIYDAYNDGKIDKCIFMDNSIEYVVYYLNANSGNIQDSIFLDYPNSSIIQGYNYLSVTADYNWFGNNATNYNQKPNVPNDVTINNWYYLDIDASKNHALISLKLTDGTQNIDNVPTLPNINLTTENENLTVANELTLKSGKAEVPYSLNNKTGSITVKQATAKMTKELEMGDFDILQNLVNENEVVNLTRNYTYNLIFDDITEGILINKPNLTINGNGFVIDAKGKSRIFKITESGVIINNVTLINAKADEGAAIWWEGDDGTIKSSTILNNTATSAIYWSSSSGDINNCILLNNSGKNIISTQSGLTADYNWFGNNESNYNINIANVEGITLNKWYFLNITLSSTHAFIDLNNIYTVDGGNSTNKNYALPNVNFTLTGVNITTLKNAIIAQEGNIDVSLSPDYKDISLTASYETASFTKNATFAGEFNLLQELIDSYGPNSVIELDQDYTYIIGADTITSGITITQNNLTINGNGHTIDAKGKTRIFNVGISGYLYGSNVTIKNTTFANGNMPANGGAILWYGGDGNLANCTFVNNTVTGSSLGGAVYIEAMNMIVFNVTFSENKASKGGAIYVFSDNVTINQSTFVKNGDGSNGGAIYWGESGDGYIIDSTFIENIATSQGGALETDIKAGTVSVINSTFIKNGVASSVGNGGAIFFGSSKNRNIINSIFTDNYASSQGGAIYLGGTNSNIVTTIYNSTFKNSSSGSGGAIYVNMGLVVINKTDFINNVANSTSNYASGGAIYDSSSSQFTVVNSNFIGNSAQGGSLGRGGVLYVAQYTNLDIANSTFIKNIANSKSNTGLGGAFYWDGGKGNVTNSTFLNNTANSGGAIYGNQASSNLNVSNSIFLFNKLVSGTLNVIYRPDSGTFNFIDCWYGTIPDSTTDMGIRNSTGVTVNMRLTLSLDHDECMVVGQDRNVRFVFEYVENGNKLIYDASKLPKINLTLSCVNGTINKNSASMDEDIAFNASVFGKKIASITAKYNGIELTELLSAKAHAIITVEPITVHVGEMVSVNVTEKLPQDAELHYYCAGDAQEDDFILVYANGGVQGKSEGATTLYVKYNEYNENEDYAPETVEVPVTVIKYNPELVTLIDSNPVHSIVVDWGAEPQTIQIDFNSDDPNPDYTGLSIDFESNDTKVAKFSTNPSLITFGAAGTANITFSTAGNERYYCSEKNLTVTVRKIASSIDLSKTDLEFGFGGSDSTTLTLVGCSVDDVNITVEGHPEAVIRFENNVINVSGLNAGTYTLKVTSTPDENHTSVTETADITVTKVDSSVEFENNVEFDYLGSGTTKLINFTGCSVDLANITVEGQDGATIGYDNVTNVITVSGLDSGTYTLKVSTTPDGNHNSVDVTADITVNRIDSSVTFADIEFDYLGSGTTAITAYDGCSVDLVNITVVGHPNAVKGFENDVITVSGLGAGTYTLNVTTTPESNYKSVSVTGNIKVNPIASQISLNETSIMYEYDGSNTTKLTLVGCSVDLINITVDGNNVAGVTYDGESQVITISGIDVGTHELKVTTTPDENHTSSYAIASITVEASNSSVGFTNPISFFYSEEGTTTLILHGCEVDVNDISVVEDSNAVIAYDSVTKVVTVSNLNIGEYTLKVITTPDGNHLSVENTTTIAVGKESPKLTMEYSNITAGEKENVFISMRIPGDVNVTIFKGESLIKTENVTVGDSGFNKVTFTDLKVGTYDITAYYKGQGRYNDSTLKYKLVVRPIYEYEFTASVNSTVMGNKTNATVCLPEGASGKLVIGDIEKVVEGTMTTIELPEQTKLGRNNATIKYVPDEDSKYAAGELTVWYDVAKVDTEISLSIVTATTNDPVTITASIKAEGNVTFLINGKKYSREIIDNVSTLELAEVAGGQYNVTAIYEGNEKYGNSSANDTFTVEKIDSSINITVNPPTQIKTNETATVTVNVDGSGIVTFTVNGEKTNVTVEGGVAELTLERLAKGTTTISAKYWGDGKYNANESEEIPLTVNPVTDYLITLDIANITVGEDAIAYITIPDDATGIVNVTVKHEDTVLFSQNTSFKVTIPDLAVGTYNITARYDGDDKYGVGEIIKEFTVNPLNVGKLNFTATVNNTIVGDKTNVTVKISSDATGKIVIGDIERSIDGSEIIVELPVQTTAGLNNITVEYVPDEESKYAPDNITAFFNVAKKAATINIADIVGVKAGQTVTIVATSYEGADIIVNVDGVETKSVENISAGKHTVIATVAETDDYLSASANKTFEATKSDVGTVALVVLENPILAGEKATLIINFVNDDATGMVEINVNGTKYSLNISETKTLELVMNDVGTVPLSGKYLGDYKYNPQNLNVVESIEVMPKNTPEIIIQVDSVSVVGDEMTINVTDLDNLIITINGIEQAVNEGKIIFTPQKDGAYTIIAKTAENRTHYAGENITSFTVINKTKQNQTIEISEIAGAKVGKEITFTVDATVSEGMTVKVNDEIVTLKDGNYTYTPKASGTYTLTVETRETEQYSKGIKTQTFTVDKNDVTVKVTVDPIKVGEKATVNVEVTPGATGDVIININGTKYSITLPQTSFEVVLDNVGTYSVSASYGGDNNFTANTSDVISLEVTQKAISNFTIEIPDGIKVGEAFAINVTCESGADLEVFVDGVKQTVNDGKVNINTLPAGIHTIEARSPVTSTHQANTTTVTFSVDKKQSDIQISLEGEFIVDKYIKLNIESYDGADIVVYMDGEVLSDWETPFKAAAGVHQVIAIVAENDEYLGFAANMTFTVDKKSSSLFVSGSHVFVGETSIIDVLIINGPTGIVIVNLNGTEYSLNISQNKSMGVVLNKAGLYYIFASYLGDDKYLPSKSEVNTIFVEDKMVNEIKIECPDEVYAGDNVTITVTSDSGAVEVYLDGVNQTLKDNKFTIENIASGTHVIEVASPETSEFKYNSTSEIINVIKKDSEVSIELPQTIVIGEDVEIKVTSTSDGDIAVFVDGVQQKLGDGKIIVKATAGNHTVIASVAENDKYKASGANSSFRVDKLDAQIAVSGVDITEGQNTTITIDTELNEGIVVVKINGTEVAVDLAKAKSVNIRLDAAGTYELSASYMGSEIYNPAEALKSTINVDKKEIPKVNVTVPEIKANESEPISISIPNATGEVHVIIDGVEEVIPLDENGNATYTVPKMSAGSHSIVVVYPGDETHDAVIKSMPFEVTKQTSQANITSPSDVKEGENATVKVEIPDATGEVAIIIDGVEHKVALVNGTVEYPLDNLSSGNHSVVVIYPGDEAHDAVYNASSFNVAGKPVIVPIESKFSDITIGENLTISVILKDENGNAIKYAPIIYTINGVANTVNTTSDGSFVIQGENGTMLIVYEGNETFMGTNTTLTLNNTVPPAPVIVRVETKFNFTSVLMIKGYVVDAKAGEKGFEFITVLSDINGNPLANKTVQLAVNSKVYNQVTNESGKVHYYFNMVRAGRYTMTYIFLGDDTCNSTLSSACVDLEKKPITIQASSKTYKVSATKKYTITLKTIVGSSLDGKAHLRAGKKVILTLNGIKYTGKTDANGKVTFNNLKLTKRANYIAKITVEEDNTYLSATKKVTLKVR